MNVRSPLGLMLLWLTALLSPVHAQGTNFTLGVAPHTSARVILEMYQPLRQHLEKTLKVTVDVQTAPDFTEFARRALKQDYDLAITTGHQARLFQTAGGYQPLLTYQTDFKAVVLVARDSAYRKAADLRGRKVLGLSPSSLVTIWGQHWLKINGLGDIPLDYISAADSVSRQVLLGEADAAFTSLANYQKLPAEQQAGLRILAESEPMAGRVYLINKRQRNRQAALDQALRSFAASPAGQAYFDQNKLGGYRPLKPKELEAMEPYAAAILPQLKNSQ